MAFCSAAAGPVIQPTFRMEAASSFTFETSVYLSSIAANTGMLRVGLFDSYSATAGTPKGAYIEQLSAGNWTAVIKNAGSSAVGNTAAAATTWTKLTIVGDGSNISFYVNGTIVGAATAYTNFPTATNSA